MKTIFRVILILVVATIIGGLMYVGVSASDTPSSFGDFDGGEGRPTRPEGMEFGEGQFRPEGDERGERGGFGFPGGIIKALVLMSIAGGIYSAIVWTGKKAKRAAAT